MPALVKRSVGSSAGTNEEEGTSRCPLATKKSMKSRRIVPDCMMEIYVSRESGVRSRAALTDYLLHYLRNIPSGKATPCQVCDDPAPLGLPGKPTELSGAFPGKRQRHGSFVAAFRPLGRQRPIDQGPLHPHREKIAGET